MVLNHLARTATNLYTKVMNQNDNNLQQWADMDVDSVNFDELESKLESDLEEQMDDLKGLELDHEKIGSPDSIGDTVKNVVWEQFINQIGVIAGEDFIKENRGLTLDLRDEAHIQTTENFEKGKIATHNDKIDYQKRFEDWQGNFQKDENGNIKMQYDHVDKEWKKVLKSEARVPFDKDRRKGSASMHEDHTVSAAEYIRDPETNAHMSKEEQIASANSDKNLHPLDSAANQSKGDHKMGNWLNSERNGKKPAERFNIDEEELKKNDKEAREQWKEEKNNGKQRSIEAGKQSQKEEAFRIGGKALRSVIMGLLAELIKDIIRKLVAWFRSGKRKLSTFIDSVKQAIKSFISNMKEHLLTAGNTSVTTIATAIFGPVIGMIKKAWIFLKQGYKSVKQAIKFLKDPANKNMPFSLKMMEVGKIVIVGLTAGGAIVLSEVIEKGLMTMPVFAFQIPLLGSLANLLGMFLGALVSGLIGALALNLIDRLISNKLKKINEAQQFDKRNDILKTQEKLVRVVGQKVESTRDASFNDIQNRHKNASGFIRSSAAHILQNSEEIDFPLDDNTEINEDDSTKNSENSDTLDKLFSDLNDMK